MPNPDELIAILDRILNGSRDESEVAQLRQWLKVSGTTLQFVSQDGKFNTNIGQVQGGEIHIGDRHYQFDVEALRELLQPTTTLPNIDWHAVSQAMLEEQLRLTTNPLTSGEGISYRTEQVYVPLGLVERKRQTRRREDVLPEQGSLLYEETEITQRFEHEQFLEQVLRQGQSPKSRGKRLAIIGEPGAGKTTLLQQIAQWVSEQVEGAIAIWVSLADLRGQELEPYLLERWLQAVVRKLGQAEASRQVKDAFVAQFQQGRVWLLLDGVDEIQVSSGNPLAEISRQVRMGGLLSQARIVLSCRLNLWDGDRNALDTFDTYRTLEFSYPQQVEQFVGQWFEALSEGQGEQAERLCAALKAPGKERIRDLVKNPLRLTLLCFNWYLGEGTLPDTKAELYEQFVADFYEWKQEQFPTTVEQRSRLNAALAELAREAIDKEATQFRLRHDFVCEFLGEPDEPDSLFQLALQLGWLNKVGMDAENPRKAVYAFFHPTFQEYFAALAIKNWHYFLNQFPENPNHPDASYRVFESQWKEVYLLWLGRDKILKNCKEDLIASLTNFTDTCNSLYKYPAYCLAASGMAEIRDCFLINSILQEVVNWPFGYFEFHLKNKTWIAFLNPNPIDELVRQTIRETNRNSLIKFLSNLAITSLHETNCREAARCLGQLGYNNLEATQTLIYLVKTSPSKQVRQQAIESLGEIGHRRSEVLDALTFHLLNAQDEEERLQAAKSLGKITPGNSNAIKILIDALLKSEDSYTSSQIGWIIRQVDTSDESLKNLVKLLKMSQSYQERQSLCEKLSYIKPDSLEATDNLKQILKSNCEEETKLYAAGSLLKIDSQDSEAISALVSLLQSTQNIEIRKSIIGCLGMLTSNSSDAVRALSKLLHPDQDITILILASEMLRHIGLGNADAILALTQSIHTNQDLELKYHLAECLGDIDPDNSDAINAFIALLNAENDEEYKVYAIDRLSRMGGNNPVVIDRFQDLLNNSQNQRVCLDAVWNLWLHSAVNRNKTYTLITKQLFNSKDEETSRLAAWRLKSVLYGNLFNETVTQLAKSLLDTTCQEKFNTHKVYFDIALYCVQKMSYLDFYRAWHDNLNIMLQL